MGKQINYYMGYNDFLSVAQAALDSGAVIYRHAYENKTWQMIGGTSLDVIKENTTGYYFHFPADGTMEIKEVYGNQHPSDTAMLHMIQAGFSLPDPEKHLLRSNRLYVITGRYDEDGIWIPRSDLLTKIHHKLVRIVKKIAPYTEIEYSVVNSMYEGKKFKTKEYISSEYFDLIENNDYTLG